VQSGECSNVAKDTHTMSLSVTNVIFLSQNVIFLSQIMSLFCHTCNSQNHQCQNHQHITRDPQWRNRLARGTYRQYLSYAEVVSSSLTWGKYIFIFFPLWHAIPRGSRFCFVVVVVVVVVVGGTLLPSVHSAAAIMYKPRFICTKVKS
jgi:hypothetical protein